LKKDIIDILCCPVCKGDLELRVEEENKEEIFKGSFTCKKCNKVYPIEDGIPNFLPE